MWRSIRRWADWLRYELIPLWRARRGRPVVVIHYQCAGQLRTTRPVPWTAESLTIEVILRLPVPARRKSDFTLAFVERATVPADSLRHESGDRFRLVFPIPTPDRTLAGELQWRGKRLFRFVLPVLGAQEFQKHLSLENAQLGVRFQQDLIPVRRFGLHGCGGLFATAIVKSKYPLAPLLDCGFAVEFTEERTGRTYAVPIALTAESRDAAQAVVVVRCPKRPRRAGFWSASWRAGGLELARCRVEAIPGERFEETVQLIDSRFVAEVAATCQVVRQPPSLASIERLGPCFVLASTEHGAAGICRFAVIAVSSGDKETRVLFERDFLVVDAPVIFAPGLIAVSELARVGWFELLLNGRSLGCISLSPVPSATLTAEGGFKAFPEFTWSRAAEDELIERLGRLENQHGSH